MAHPALWLVYAPSVHGASSTSRPSHRRRSTPSPPEWHCTLVPARRSASAARQPISSSESRAPTAWSGLNARRRR
eukprot:2144823-Pyramimonas_sp.AAC.1